MEHCSPTEKAQAAWQGCQLPKAISRKASLLEHLVLANGDFEFDVVYALAAPSALFYSTDGAMSFASSAYAELPPAELRAALEAAGADSKGLKPALVERLVEVRRRASGRRRTPPTLSPVAFSETDDDPPPRASPAKRVWGLRRRFSPRKLRTRRPRAAALSPEEPSQ